MASLFFFKDQFSNFLISFLLSQVTPHRQGFDNRFVTKRAVREDASFQRLDEECGSPEMETPKRDFESIIEENENLRKQLAKVTEDFELLKKKGEENKCLENNFQEKLLECEKLKGDLREEMDRSETVAVEVKVLREEEKNYQEILKGKTDEMEALQNKLQQEIQRIGELEQLCSTLDEVKELNTLLQDDLEQKVKKCESLEAALDEISELCGQFEKKSNLFEVELNNIKQEYQKLEETFREELDRNGVLSVEVEKLKASEGKHGNNGTLVKELVAEKTALEKELRDAESQKNELEKDLARSKSEADLLR